MKMLGTSFIFLRLSDIFMYLKCYQKQSIKSSVSVLAVMLTDGQAEPAHC